MACTCNLAAVDRECGRNAPGLKTQFYVACVDDISAIGAASSHVVSTITMAASKVFFTWNAVRKDNDQNSEPQDGGGFNTQSKYFLPKQSAAKSNILTSLSGEENYVVITQDQNDVKHILGSLAHPVRIRVKPVATPKNGYEVTIFWDGHADIPFTFSGTVPV